MDMQNMDEEGQARFEWLIDLLLESLNKEDIEPLILNGFDEWSQLQEVTLKDLTEIGYSEQTATKIISCIRTVQNLNQIQLTKQNPRVSEGSLEEPRPESEIPLETPSFPENPITQQLLFKGTTMKPTTKTMTNFLSGVTMIALEQKKITRICNLEEMKSLQILHLSSNCISKVEGLESCVLLRTLKLDHNYITKIEGLETLSNLGKLTLNHNYIRTVGGMDCLYSLTELNLSDQQISSGLTFKEGQLGCIGQSLEIFYCNNNKITDISEFRYLRMVSHLEMKNNSVKEVSSLADVLPHMARIKSMLFVNNPVTKAPKYRDYLIILSKCLQEIDSKKILPTERQYLVKLYSLKNAKQNAGDKTVSSKAPLKEPPEITVNKLEGEIGVHNLNTPKDFHSNVAYQVSKKTPNYKH